MIFSTRHIQAIFLVFLFIVYNYSIFGLGDTFLENPRLKKIFRVPVGLLNTICAVGFTLLPNSTSLTSYVCIGCLLFLEFYLFYRENILRIMALVLSFLIHIMVVRSISVSIFSLSTGMSIYGIVNETGWYIVTMNVTFIVINIMLFAVKKLLSRQNAGIITEHAEQLIFLISWTGIGCVYFFFNAGIYSKDLPYSVFGVQNQLAVSVTLLSGYYVVLIFSILVGKSMYYKQKNAELTNMAERDSLTGLYNKGATQKHISDFIARKTEQPQKGALFIIDADDFKTINDRFGHAFGDSVLCTLAEKLKAIFRNSAGAGARESAGDIIGRVGGDEFMVFMKNTNDGELLKKKAESIRNAFKNAYQDSANNITVISASIGIAVFPENGTSFEELYKCADISLYQSKNRGKNTHSFYSGEEFVGYQNRRDTIE